MTAPYIQAKYPSQFGEGLVLAQLEELKGKTKHLTGTTVATLVNGNLNVDGQLKVNGVVVTPGGGGGGTPQCHQITDYNYTDLVAIVPSPGDTAFIFSNGSATHSPLAAWNYYGFMSHDLIAGEGESTHVIYFSGLVIPGNEGSTTKSFTGIVTAALINPSWMTEESGGGDYLPLTGGTLTGELIVNSIKAPDYTQIRAYNNLGEFKITDEGEIILGTSYGIGLNAGVSTVSLDGAALYFKGNSIVGATTANKNLTVNGPITTTEILSVQGETSLRGHPLMPTKI
jgi:hypothetical protein